jgi:hypothetical protein
MTTRDRLGAAVAVFLGLTGAFGFIVGGHDVGLPDEPFSVTIGGAFVLLAGLLALTASIPLALVARRRWPMRDWIGRAAMSACLAVAMVAAFFVVAEVSSFDTNGVIIAVAALVFAGGVAGLAFLLVATRVTLGKVGTTLIGVLGTAFGVFQFWFAQQYVPTRQPAALEATATLEPAGIASNGLRAFRATLVLENVGKTKVIALAGAYHVSGSTIPRREVDPSPKNVLEPFLSTSVNPYATRFSRHAGLGEAPEIVQAGRLFAENRYFEPGEQVTRRFIVYTPACGSHTMLRLRAHAVVAKGTLIRIRDSVVGSGTFEDTVDDRDRMGVYTQWAIKDDSWIHDILEGKEHSILVNYVGSAGRFDVSFFRVTAWLIKGTEKRRPDEIASYTARARERLGLANSFSDDELALSPPRPAAKC